MKTLNKVLNNFKETIFTTMSRKALKHQAINLSQGFPDFPPAEWLNNLQKKYSHLPEYQQYAAGNGISDLRKTLSQVYKEQYDLSYHPDREITVTSGATEALFCSIMAICNPGDEVIVFEPYYDSYKASIQYAGATPITVTLHSPGFNFNTEELSAALSDKTKAIVLNSPHNPTGKIFSEQELKKISQICQERDLYLISDEVYEYLTYDDIKHSPIAQLKGMQERTITISSAGKTFGATGWKVGWACTSETLTHAIRMVHQFTTFSVHHASQKIVSDALLNLKNYIPEFQKEYQSKRDYFFKQLQDLGYQCYKPQGTYFIMANIENKTQLKDIGYSLELIETRQVATIPPSVFYDTSKDGEKYLRFCFAKKMETLEAAARSLS
jgi:aspartate/methionine/tyrosine aminotransferase